MTSLGHEQMPAGERLRDVAAHLVLPVTALVLGILPVLVRYVRASVADALAAPFVRAARAHGIPERRVLFRHALPAAANPLISLFGLSLAGLLSTSLLVEVVMSWPGLGPLMLEAILSRDFYLVLGPVLASTLLLVGGNLLADALLLAADPRIRSEQT
jgi:peptide/nickel transport system permease protein